MIGPVGKLRSDLMWSVGSLVVLAGSGIVVNVLIAVFWDAAALGVFNQTYAVYVVVSQVAALGLHVSVLRETALMADDRAGRSSMLWSAAVPALVLGTLAAGGLALAAGPIGALLDSEDVARSVFLSAAGIAVFPLNKVLIAYVNGRRFMRAFAIFQSLRYGAVAGWIGLITVVSTDFADAALAFVVAEVLTAAGTLLFLLATARDVGRGQVHAGRMRRHLSFGGRAVAGGIFMEMNTRVDVVFIGYFLGDSEVGIYSFAAMLADGMFHLLAVVRSNLTPITVALIRDRQDDDATRLIRKVRLLLPAFAALSVAVVAGFVVALAVLAPGRGFEAGVAPLAVLLAGLTLVSPLVPLDATLSAAGHPGLQTAQQFVVLVVNCVLNALLIPGFGITGAALGTAGAYLAGGVVLVALCRRTVGWNLLTGRVARRGATAGVPAFAAGGSE